ncbi:MAG TPA: prolipoprotein diacylglyceryl transferase family protein [Actinomycetota bacterium]|nr:prolipoprotein diacylglyceryl transferase family protein [Actinomycetota bacterium]
MDDRIQEGLAIQFFDPLAWEIFPRIELGPVGISPHGIGIAAGYLAGAQLMVRRARRFGGPDENDIWNALFYALIGAIVGARVGYVLGHFSEVTDGGNDILGIFKIWEGGISLIGGITGAVLFALPYVLRRNMGFWRTLDLAAPGVALGIVIGRIGDLVIGDHLGKPTDFALGWRCLGSAGDPPVDASVYRDALEAGNPPSLGCFDLVVHQTALYDFFSTLALLGVLLYLGRRVRNTGFLILVFTCWYGAMRVITDFLRVDRRYFGLTGSQLMSLTVGLICLYLLARYRGAPPAWQGAGGRGPDDGDGPDAGAFLRQPAPTGAPGTYGDAEIGSPSPAEPPADWKLDLGDNDSGNAS